MNKVYNRRLQKMYKIAPDVRNAIKIKLTKIVEYAGGVKECHRLIGTMVSKSLVYHWLDPKSYLLPGPLYFDFFLDNASAAGVELTKEELRPDIYYTRYNVCRCRRCAGRVKRGLPRFHVYNVKTREAMKKYLKNKKSISAIQK